MSADSSPAAKPLAIISGGSAGLGLVIAQTFADAGYELILLGRSAERLEAAQRQLQAAGSAEVQWFACDATDPHQLRDVAANVTDRFGHLDVLVNCVGTSDRGRVCDLDASRVHQLIDQNVIATLHCSQAMLPLLERCGGVVVNIGSLSGKVGARFLGGYNLAKHALAGLTQQMRLEWREKGVHVGLVSPGPIRRDDAGHRYKDRVDDSLPEQAARPGGGTRVKGLPPERVAAAVLKCVRRRRPDLILPGYLRLLITLGNASPRVGDWLLLRFTS
ncbi:SDR family NAD(P)-dependent oxidoreductase [Roseiconus nitratireducens]|uniref:SDR family NAD(P)-dependent oxidoreductase n=1 Tax=Roseiconus nitratireducens TaxID=2605748 RepID=UPI00137612D9|nr:SDR family NAD(P)-dependent oxidoreductase [Roseiconus nitratireducens]